MSAVWGIWGWRGRTGEQAGSEHRGIVGLTNACGMKSVGDGSFWTYEWG